DEEGEDECADEWSLQVGRMAQVAQTGAHRAEDALGGEGAREDRLAFPAPENPDDGDKGRRVEREDPAGAGIGVEERSDHKAAECRTEGARDVIAGGVECDGGWD